MMPLGPIEGSREEITLSLSGEDRPVKFTGPADEGFQAVSARPVVGCVKGVLRGVQADADAVDDDFYHIGHAALFLEE